MHLQNFIKIHQLVHKILNINEISTSIKGHNSVQYCSIIQIFILSISMHIQNLIKIHKLIHKILSINKILTSIKGLTLLKIDPKQCALDTTWILYSSMHIQNFIKIHPFVLKIWRKNTFLHQSRAITVENERKILFAHPNLHLANINAYTKSDRNQLIHKILSINNILMLIKGQNSVKN